jgi:hypothetical protein
MSARIREALIRLEDDTASLRLASPTQIRARGDTLRRRRIAGAAAATVTVTVAGVFAAVAATGGPTVPAPVGASPATSSPTITTTECGTYVLGQGEDLPQAAVACFLNAVAAGRPARLAETRPTIEGDPIHSGYVADGTGAVQVTVDSRQDRFGERGVFRKTCTGPIAYPGLIGFTHCSSQTPV